MENITEKTVTSRKPVTINVINKRTVTRYKYYDYKNTLGEFLSKNCFTREENVETAKNFRENYTDYLDQKVSKVIDNLKNTGDDMYKELLLNKSFEGRVCTFNLSRKINDLKTPGHLELFCDGKRVMKKHFKDVSKAIMSIMKIKGSDVLFNGNPIIVNNNLSIAESDEASFVVTF